MDSLRSTYRDEEDDEDESLPTTAASATLVVKTSASDNGFHENGAAAISTKIEPTDLPPTTNDTASDAPMEPVIGIKSDPDQSEELSESEPASEDTDAKRSPKSIRATDNEDEEEDDEPPPKKKKQLSSITGVEEQEALPIANGSNGGLKNGVGVAVTAMSTPTTTGSNSKKSKKKNNNVWVTKSTRKGKKKNKGSNTNNTPTEDPVLITPVQRFPDKNDDSPDMKICLSKVFKAEKVELSEDRMSASSTKGYRMVRATRGVTEGAWYFEIKVVRLGDSGHTRMGWSTEKGDLQAPVGYDGNSFGYRDIDGSKVHKALREKYGEGYKEGDVVGFYINLPNGGAYAPKPSNLVWYKGQRYVCAPDAKEDPPKVVPGSEIAFFKNGVWQGAAFTDLFGGRYYPAASMYTLPNQPSCLVQFNFGPDFEFFPQDLGERPQPRPMVDVPYHGFDSRVENGESVEKKAL